MKNKLIITAIVSLAALIMLGIAAQGYDVPRYIKAGIFFNSVAKSEFSADVSGGVSIGHEYNYAFFEDMRLAEAKSVSVTKGGGIYLRSQNTYSDLGQASTKAQQMRTLGMAAYGSYLDGQYYVAVGQYNSLQEAQNSIPHLAASELEFAPYTASTKAVCANSGGYFFMFHSEQEVFTFAPINKESGYIGMNGRKYRGGFMASRQYSNNIAILNLVSMDDYLASVVGSEMYPSWHIDALKAQAVIARTFACIETKYKGYGVDVSDDTSSQAYFGIDKETAKTRQAASETSGQVVLYKGKPAETYFYSSNGGRTADVYSAWGGGAGLDYLVSVPDPYDTESGSADINWSVTLSADQVKLKLANSGIDIGDITGITVVERGEQDQRVRKMKFTGTLGEKTVTFQSCRTILGLKSQYFYIHRQGVSDPVVSSPKYKVIVLWGSYVLKVKVSDDSSAENGNGQTNNSQTPAGDFVIDGHGYGHGVGLSQYGASVMAQKGLGYRKIIEFYYPGTALSE